MSVLKAQITVMARMHSVLTRIAVLHVHAMMAVLEMELPVQVPNVFYPILNIYASSICSALHLN